MLKKYFLINSLFSLIAYRKVRHAVRGRLFYAVLGSLVGIFALIALSIIVTPTVQAVISGAALGGSAVDFSAIVGSFFTNATIESALVYVLWSFFANRDDGPEQMLAIWRVARWTRNMIFRTNAILLLLALSLCLFCALLLPGIVLSVLVPELKLSMVVCISLQMLLTLTCVSVIDSGLGILLDIINVPFARGARLSGLIVLLGLYFIGYFTGSQSPGDPQSAIYCPTLLSSYFLLASIADSGVTALQVALSIVAYFLAFFLLFVLCRVERPLSSSVRSWRLLKGIGFAKGSWSMVSKALKELVRNKDRTANLSCMLLILLVLRFAYPVAFESGPLVLAVAFPAVNFLYAASRECDMRHIYAIRSLRVSRVVGCRALASTAITALEILVMSLFFPLGTVVESAGSLGAGIVFAGGGFYLLGVLFPIDTEHPFSTPAIIALLVVGLMPLMVVLFQFADAIGIDASVVCTMLAAVGILFGLVAGRLLCGRLKSWELR